MASFVLFFFPLDVLDEIWDLIESVSERFLTYSYFNISFSLIVCFISFLVIGNRNRLLLPDSLLRPLSNLMQKDNMANSPI